ncbi:DNA repair protein (plasmid) [Aromatoleum aromaticum EbN1]|uniref:DNA repair protein n=1 Tax=Aromatoleum aromaticum (strain DSM 19018 / LMG 30748 / EbN1) TaxID=76114 RepID=Q5NWB9_AROAE|nr:translesion error-prone DNA polymerase V autoproteolytic subunit [Aromatoleum aromaticum]CAI10645.1 DNA repair protein [Aromatoleum aromaticum EbN1]
MIMTLLTPLSDLSPAAVAGLRYPSPTRGCLAIPLGLAPVSAGFPSPAEDYEDKKLDINDYLVRNPVSTFYFPVKGDSMQGAQVFDGDILVVDRSVMPAHGHVVIAFVNGERLVKRFHRRGDRIALLAENPGYPPLELTEGSELVIWGVVIGKFSRIPT